MVDRVDDDLDLAGPYNCPICTNIFQSAITTACGHSFCGDCLIQYWRTSNARTKVNCPICRTAVSMIIPNYVVRDELLRRDKQVNRVRPLTSAQIDRTIDDYNTQFAEQVQEGVANLRRATSESFMYKFMVWGLILIVAMYILIPVDLIPEEVGLLGYLDDLAVFAIVMLVLVKLAETYRWALIQNLHRRVAN